MSTFKKLNTKPFAKTGSTLTADNIYWKELGVPVLVKEFGPIDYIDFSPVQPNYFAVTCSVRVQIYNPVTKLVTKNLSRFRENAYGATFRSDGKLLCAGGEEAAVKLFDVSSKSLLRLFQGHKAPVHRTFFVQDRPQIASFSDDKTVKLWDIPTEKTIQTFSEHTDYIRAGAINPMIPDVIISGGYDNIIKMYDTRDNKICLSVDHESPVESLLFLPTGGIFISSGGNYIKIWDSLTGGKLLANISQHHKTVTCVRLASDNKRLLSASLDRHVKVYDLANFEVVHTFDFPNSILSLGVSKNDDTLVAGLVDGLVSIQCRQQSKNKEKEKKVTSFVYAAKHVDTFVPDLKGDKYSKHDKFLRKFEHSKALKSVLVNYVANKHPEITVSVIQELIKRKAFEKAIVNKDSVLITALLRFLAKNIPNLHFSKILIDAANIFINVYTPLIGFLSPEIVALLQKLSQLLAQEVQLAKDMLAIEGVLHMLMASAITDDDSVPKSQLHLLPSTGAQNYSIKIGRAHV